MVLHGFNFGSGNSLFAKEFIDNATFIVLFQVITDNRQLKLFCNNLFDGKKDVILECFNIANELALIDKKRPYVFINVDQRQHSKPCHRFRLDIFNRNLIITNNNI